MNFFIKKPFKWAWRTSKNKGICQLTLFLVNQCYFQMWKTGVNSKNQLHVSRSELMVSRNDLLQLPRLRILLERDNL